MAALIVADVYLPGMNSVALMIASPFVAAYHGWKAIGDGRSLVVEYHDWSNPYTTDYQRLNYENTVADYRHHLLWALGACGFMLSKYLSFRRAERSKPGDKGPWVYRGRIRDIPGRMLLMGLLAFGVLWVAVSGVIRLTTGSYY